MIYKDAFHNDTIMVIRRAFKFAAESGSNIAGSEHILWSLCEEDGSAASKVLLRAGLEQSLVKEVMRGMKVTHDSAGMTMAMNLAAEAEKVAEASEAVAKKYRHGLVEPEHLLLAILQDRNCTANKLIASTGANLAAIRKELLEVVGNTWPRDQANTHKKKQKKLEAVEKFSRDLTDAAAKGKLDPVIGRDNEIERTIQILSRRTKNNPVLIGESGVGKTAIAEGLAQRIVCGDVPTNLLEQRIVAMDLSKMLAGTKYRGDFEENMKSFLEEVEQGGNIIVLIDEMHSLIGAGGTEGALDAANIFKPALGRGLIRVIGATTLNEYKKYVEKDVALERRFQPITVNEPSEEDAVEILMGIRHKYEDFHQLVIQDEAVKAAVSLSKRYVQDRFLPDKAIDLMDEAASRVKTCRLTAPDFVKVIEEQIQSLHLEKQKAVNSQDFEAAAVIRDKQKQLREMMRIQQNEWMEKQRKIVGKADIAEVVSSWTGIPVTMMEKNERERLLLLEDALHKRMIGQEEAVKAVSKAIRRSRTGIKDPNRPVGTFLFLGPTGVGKTELCRSLAEVLFQDENAIIRMDMSEYMERHTVSKLIGSPPGYVGYQEGGQLTEKVRRKPYSIVLFDEIEKAHEDVWNALLQIMDEGKLTDGQGRTVSFKNTIIVMTSNIGAREISGKTSLGFSAVSETKGIRPIEEIKDKVMEQVKKTFEPEFINRIDEVVVFHQLESTHIYKIAKYSVEQLAERLSKQGYKLSVQEKIIQLASEKGFNPIYGARLLKRTIQSMIEDAISEKMLETELNEGDEIVVAGRGEKITVKIKQGTKKNNKELINTTIS